MMKTRIRRYLLIVGILTPMALFSGSSFAEDGHHHDKHTDSDHQNPSDPDGNAKEHGEVHDHDDEEHEEVSSSVGPTKALLAVRNHGAEFQLAEEAKTTLGLKVDKPSIDENGNWRLPRQALISHQEEYSVYRIEEGNWIRSIRVKYLKSDSHSVWLKSSDLRKDDLIVTEGAPFLRLAELEASGKGGEGHAH